jgi:Family of unknown function (DUF6511)
MHPALVRYMGKVPTVCAICRRRAAGFGYTPRKHAIGNVVWLCGSEYCHRAAKEFYAMSAERFDEYELGAMLEAGRDAGGYLDKIGKTDLKLLSGEEWREFLSRLLTGYEHALRRKLLNNEPPLDSLPCL